MHLLYKWVASVFSRLRNQDIVPVLKWIAVGIIFTAYNAAALYVLQEILNQTLFISTMCLTIIGTTLRFFVNDRWVFGYKTPNLRRFYKYVMSAAIGLILWIGLVNLFTYLGLHYQISALLAMAVTITFNMAINFLWVWKRKSQNEDSIAK